MLHHIWLNAQGCDQTQVRAAACRAPCFNIMQDEPRSKTLKRQVRKALGMGKKLTQKQGTLIYKGMPG